MFESIIKHIGDAVGGWLYLIAGALAFAEAAILVGMVLPGETALLVAGVFCQRGVLNLWLMIPIAVVCAVAGDSVGFEFGRKFGPSLRRSRLGVWVGEHRWAAVDGFLHRHGGKAVFLGRLTALFRALIPSMAGMSGMRYRTFLAWNLAGGLLWAPGLRPARVRILERAVDGRQRVDLGPAGRARGRRRGRCRRARSATSARTGRGRGLRGRGSDRGLSAVGLRASLL